MKRLFLAPLVISCLFAPVLQAAKVLNIVDPPGLAVGDGAADNRGALMRAFSALEPGDTLLIPPGNYKVVLGKTGLAVPKGVTVLGQSGKSRFLLSSTGGKEEYREFLRPRSGVTLEGLVIEREGGFPVVLMPVTGDVENLTLRNCSIVGNAAKFSEAYCHALQVGGGTLKNFLLDGVEITGCTYGLFQPNAATGTVDTVMVQNSRFEQNQSSDLEFNAPRGQMRNITVRHCLFRNNRSKNASGGFAVGFANVQNASVEDCRIENYGAEALHVEDRSADIRLVGNTITGGSTVQSNGVIMVVNHSTRIAIERNFIDARPNANRAHLILVTAGGAKFAKPTEVLVTGNVLLLGAATPKWYLEPGSTLPPVGNHVLPSADSD